MMKNRVKVFHEGLHATSLKHYLCRFYLRIYFCQIQMLIEDKGRRIYSLLVSKHFRFIILILNLNFDWSKFLNFFSIITFGLYCQVTMLTDYATAVLVV